MAGDNNEGYGMSAGSGIPKMPEISATEQARKSLEESDDVKTYFFATSSGGDLGRFRDGFDYAVQAKKYGDALQFVVGQFLKDRPGEFLTGLRGYMLPTLSVGYGEAATDNEPVTEIADKLPTFINPLHGSPRPGPLQAKYDFVIEGGVYQHILKGGKYQVLALAIDASALDMSINVVYRAISDYTVYTRSLNDFTRKIFNRIA